MMLRDLLMGVLGTPEITEHPISFCFSNTCRGVDVSGQGIAPNPQQPSLSPATRDAVLSSESAGLLKFAPFEYVRVCVYMPRLIGPRVLLGDGANTFTAAGAHVSGVGFWNKAFKNVWVACFSAAFRGTRGWCAQEMKRLFSIVQSSVCNVEQVGLPSPHRFATECIRCRPKIMLRVTLGFLTPSTPLFENVTLRHDPPPL